MKDFFNDNSFIIFTEALDNICVANILVDKGHIEYDEWEDTITVYIGKDGQHGDMEIRDVNSKFEISTGLTEEGGEYIMLKSPTISLQFVSRGSV